MNLFPGRDYTYIRHTTGWWKFTCNSFTHKILCVENLVKITSLCIKKWFTCTMVKKMEKNLLTDSTSRRFTILGYKWTPYFLETQFFTSVNKWPLYTCNYNSVHWWNRVLVLSTDPDLTLFADDTTVLISGINFEHARQRCDSVNLVSFEWAATKLKQDLIFLFRSEYPSPPRTNLAFGLQYFTRKRDKVFGSDYGQQTLLEFAFVCIWITSLRGLLQQPLIWNQLAQMWTPVHLWLPILLVFIAY